MIRIIKYLKHPTYFPEQWTVLNPLLLIGEIGFERDTLTGKVTRHKVGPGNWNDLDYEDSSIYDYVDEVTNPIGDAKLIAGLTGKASTEILHMMLSPYIAPSASGFVNNAGTGFQNIHTRQIGQNLSGSVVVNWIIQKPENLSGGSPVQLSAGGIFNNEGNFPNLGSATLNLPAPLAPTVPTEYTINLALDHLQGVTSPVTSKIRFWPKIMWVVSPLADIPDSASFMSIVNRQEIVSNDYKKDYSFPGNGYCWLAVPAMLGLSDAYYADVKNPILPVPFGISDKGQLLINNGVASYLYTLRRSTYYLTDPTILRVSV